MKFLGFACLFAAATLCAQSTLYSPAGIVPLADANSHHANSQPKMLQGYGKLPLSFEPNLGQSDSSVRFLSHGAGYTLFLTSDEAVVSLRPGGRSTKSAVQSKGIGNLAHEGDTDLARGNAKRQPRLGALHMQLLGARRDAAVSGAEELPGKINYFLGNDPKNWETNIPTFAKVRYHNVFEGVDLVYYGNQGQLEYDFVVGAGAEPGAIHLAFSGARGMYVDPQTGDLVLKMGKMGKGDNEVRFHKPLAYQDLAYRDGASGTNRELVAANYIVDSRNHVRFQLGPYDHNRTLLIDPTLSYSTYLGGSSNDYGTSLAVDNAGNAYVTGYTSSSSFPVTAGSYQTKCGGCAGGMEDAFVTKLDPTGSFLIYSTFLGGTGNDIGNGIALDPSGDVYVVGQTFSPDFPATSGAFQRTCGGGTCVGGDAFITELDPSGASLVYSTYLGGPGVNQGNAIALNAAGDAYVIGYTESATFPTTPGAYQTKLSKGDDVFVTELNSAGSGLIYSTYLGGTNKDLGYAIALDASDHAYITGFTQSTDFPTTAGAFQTFLTANTAAFVTELNSTGSALLYSTYLGGITKATTACEACGTSIVVDSSGNAYVCGLTAEATFPVTPGAFQTTFLGHTNGHDAFVTKLNPTGTALVYSTYVGGDGDTGATSIALDPSNNVWIKGNTMSAIFPVTPGAFQTVLAGDFDAYVAQLNPTGSTLLYGSYLGGSGTEYGGATRALVLDNQSPPNVYVTGYTDSTNFPSTAGSFQPKLAGANDAFVSKFAPSPNAGLAPSSLSFGNQNIGTTSTPQAVILTNTGNESLAVTEVSITGTNSRDFGHTGACGELAPNATCTINVTFAPTISGAETADLSIADNAANSPQLVPLSGTGVATGPVVVLSATSLTFATQLVNTSSAVQVVTLTNTGGAALTISGIVTKGDFSQTNTCGSSVAAGANCTISVTFRPTQINSRFGSITVTDNAPTSPQVVSLTGVGTYISLSPASLSFGTVALGKSSTPQVITLTNADSAAVRIGTVSVTGTDPGDFTQSNTCGASVAAKGSCSITVTFTPTAAGARSANVSVTDAGGGSPQTASLSGTGQ
ncbi:MAG: choice-of-anchor D domain-containing protein [Candidatus Sulfotelmatobacter sp.]|jgi:hypothetical protein